VVDLEQTRIKEGGSRRSTLLAPDATDVERYMANRWGRLLLGGSSAPVARMLRPRSERTRHFDLFQSGPSTFLEFAQAPFTTDGIKALADRYGPLRTQMAEQPCFDDYLGHRIFSWFSEIRELRKAVELWEQSSATGNFSKIIRTLERRSERHFQRDREVGVSVNVLLKKDPLDASARLCIRPTHLRDALWIQLALAIDGNLNLRACIECRSWFTLEAGRGRSDKEYCSNACRMRAYRKRKGKQ
jgi:hypothetical protein